MKSFQPQFFHVLPKAEMVARCPWLVAKDVDDTYMFWLDSFRWHARHFYRMQLQRHSTLVADEFYKVKGLSREYTLAEQADYYIEEYENLFAERLDEHHKGYIEAEREIVRFEQGIDFEHEDVWIGETSHFKAMMAMAEAKGKHPYAYARRINQVWFDWTIQSTPDEVSALRRIPYKDYLQTDHWRRVRSAMLLIDGAKCAGQNCVPESYWGDEDMIHVHHLSYRNRGQERYDDLALLCSRCHATAHERGIEFVLGIDLRQAL